MSHCPPTKADDRPSQTRPGRARPGPDPSQTQSSDRQTEPSSVRQLRQLISEESRNLHNLLQRIVVAPTRHPPPPAALFLEGDCCQLLVAPPSESVMIAFKSITNTRMALPCGPHGGKRRCFCCTNNDNKLIALPVAQLNSTQLSSLARSLNPTGNGSCRLPLATCPTLTPLPHSLHTRSIIVEIFI